MYLCWCYTLTVLRRCSTEASAAQDDVLHPGSTDHFRPAFPGEVWEPSVAARQCWLPKHSKAKSSQLAQSFLFLFACDTLRATIRGFVVEGCLIISVGFHFCKSTKSCRTLQLWQLNFFYNRIEMQRQNLALSTGWGMRSSFIYTLKAMCLLPYLTSYSVSMHIIQNVFTREKQITIYKQ